MFDCEQLKGTIQSRNRITCTGHTKLRKRSQKSLYGLTSRFTHRLEVTGEDRDQGALTD